MILLILTALVTFGGWIFWNWKINKTFGSISHDQDVAETYAFIEKDLNDFNKPMEKFWEGLYQDRKDAYIKDPFEHFKYIPYEPKFSYGIDPVLPGDDISEIGRAHV